MNDPFNVRRPSPRSPLQATFGQASDYFAARSTATPGEQYRNTDRTLRQESTSIPSLPLAGMSSSQGPSGSQTRQDSSGWRPRRVTNPQIANFQSPSVTTNVSDKINNMLSTAEEEELPMYKDKPYNYATSERRLPFWRRQRLFLVLLGVLIVIIYFAGTTTRTPKSPVIQSQSAKEKSTWNLLSGISKSRHSPPNWEDRREKVKDAFKISWEAYEKHAWGYDEFHPMSETGRQMVEPNGMGWIIVDALDTMILMNLTSQLAHAREWVSTTLSWDLDHDHVNTFEVTIRMLGGLLAAHYLSTEFPNLCPVPALKGSQNEDLYLEKATDLADRLLSAYESPSGIPYASVNLHHRRGNPSTMDGGASSTSEAGSVQLEMKYLAKLTGEANYWTSAEKIMKVIDDNGMEDGLLPIFIYASDGTFRGDNIRLGSRGDSYYEYLIKQYLQTSTEEPIYQDMWDQALSGIQKHLITYTKQANLTLLAERPLGLSDPVFPKMDHLVCFMPGTIALGTTLGRTVADMKNDGSWTRKNERELDLATQLMKTCWGMYQVTTTGLAPEIAHFRIHDPPLMMNGTDPLPQSMNELRQDSHTEWRMDYDIHVADFHNLQRPEFVESLFYMWRITKEQKYRDWGWQIFEAFVQHTSLPNGKGFSSVGHVDKIPPPTRDNMESFWLAETLKYLYLLFGPDDILPLDQVILNTEAHPLPKFGLGKLFKTGWERKARDSSGKIIKSGSKGSKDGKGS